MPERSDGPNSFKDPDVGRGGADAVPGTPDLPGHGTEPEGPMRGIATANVGAGGMTVVGWIVVLLALIVVLVYGFGFGR